MCGICGVAEFRAGTSGPVDIETLQRMTDSLSHRGPDDVGYHVGAGVAIGVRRLSIVDVPGGHQPFYNELGQVVAAQNGELYNHAEIRRALEARGHVLRSRCDTEILPHLYEDRGLDLVEPIVGMFAFVIWDSDRGRLVLVRDRIGIKPLYYTETAERLLVFGSELKAVLASGLVSPEIDPLAVDMYLTLGFVPGPRTLIRGVKKLLPGELLVADRSGIEVRRYWNYPAPAPATIKRDDEAWAGEFLERLRESVRLRLMSDVPLGAMLSGGLDSAVIAALMAGEMSAPLKTFTVGFSGSPDNEIGAARVVADALGAEHHAVELSLDDAPDLDELIWALDEPVADLSALGFHALSRVTAEQVTVALSGQGADELLAGYGRYRQFSTLSKVARLPSPLLRAVTGAGSILPDRLKRGLAVAASEDMITASLLARSEWATSVRDVSAERPPRQFSDGVAEVVRTRIGGVEAGQLERAMMLDGQLSLVDDMLHYFDRMSMAHSLEVRVPFLDHRLVEFAATIPAALKIRGDQTKYLLRRAAAELVPSSVLERPKVGFFSTAVEGWLTSQLDSGLADVLRDPSSRISEFVDSSVVAALLRNRESRRTSRLLFSLLILELWLSRYLPRALAPSAVPRSAALH